MSTTTETSKESVEFHTIAFGKADEDSEASSVRPPTPDEENSVPEGNAVYPELLPVDGGLAAWRVLLVSFFFTALFWGYPMSFGIFQNYYSALPEFKQDQDRIALIGTVAQAFAYIGAPFSAALAKRFVRFRRQQIWFGWSLAILGLLCASFASSVPALVACQGVMYGFGFVLLMYPIVSMINEWWVARKGMALGLISAASGLTGAVMPFILEALLSRYGYRTTLRASAVTMALLTFPLLPLLKGRLPLSGSNASSAAPTNWSFVRKPLFWVYSISTILSGFGLFFPAIFLPSYASSLGISHLYGALLLAIMCITSVFGQFAFGWLSDKGVLSVGTMASGCAVISAVAVLVLWGLGKSLALLILLSSLYGFFAYGYATMRVGMGRAVVDDSSGFFATYAIFIFMQGAGNLLVGPISSQLITHRVVIDEFGAWKYQNLIVFTAACWLASGLVIPVWSHTPRVLRILRQKLSAFRE